MALGLASCAKIQIKDETIYALKGPGYGALKAQTLSQGEEDLTQGQWDSISTGMFCMSATSFGDYKSAIEKLCSFNPSECDYQTTTNIKAFFSHLKTIAHHSKTRRNKNDQGL